MSRRRLSGFFLVYARRRRRGVLAPRAAAFIRRPLTPSTHQTALRVPDDETEVGPPKKARAGLIKSFELDRRKQSENSNRVTKSPSKKSGDGTAVAAGAPANTAELPPALFVGRQAAPVARVRGLCERETGLLRARTFEARVLVSMRDSGSCRP